MSLKKIEKGHKSEADDRTIFGFWVYLMTDLVMFAGLFAAFAVLRNSTVGAISMHELFNGPFVLTETIILLISS
ncbi:MAG TPA: cytochrome o ubiquinol oxidase subunit III, partial [Methylomirabilota bacterium]|nr:cytochrome o ubiquinol oxidase subunit III [Methylomirabilota bacterium]